MPILFLIAAAGRAHRATRPRTAFRAARAPVLLVLLALAAAGAQADICKYIDQEGNVHYTNVAPEKGWKRQGCSVGDDGTPRSPSPAGSGTAPRNAATPPGFPRVDPGMQRGRDDMRRKVLTEELATEETLLAEARLAYADGAPAPLPEEKADAERYRARIGKLRQALNVHEKNVEALKKEIAIVK